MQRAFRAAPTRSTPPKAADFAALRRPVRSCRTPPVAAPAMMEFQGSSYGRMSHSSGACGQPRSMEPRQHGESRRPPNLKQLICPTGCQVQPSSWAATLQADTCCGNPMQQVETLNRKQL